MAKSLSEMVAQGRAKLAAKGATMVTSYNAAKGRMIEGYNGMPFGPTRKSAYSTGVQGGTYHAPDPDKWAKNWQAKMSE